MAVKFLVEEGVRKVVEVAANMGKSDFLRKLVKELTNVSGESLKFRLFDFVLAKKLFDD